MFWFNGSRPPKLPMARLPRTTILSPLRPNTFKPPRGQKPIYLYVSHSNPQRKTDAIRPNFTLTLLRTPFLPPQFASFIVPLNFNKLDLKDYLYHAYNVPVLSVRSYVQQQRVRQDKPGAKLPKQARWYRPRSIKKMTIEMADLPGGGPFVWPDEEEDLEPYDQLLPCFF